MAYGKALSTYRRVNKIKRSAENISQVQSQINRQRIKSVREARDLQSKRDIANAVTNAIQTGAGLAMSEFNLVSPERATQISTVLGGAAEVGSTLAVPMSNSEFLGLSTEEFRQINDEMNPDVAGGAIDGFSLQESLNEIKKRKQANKAIKGFSEDERMGFSKDELFQFLDEVDYDTERTGRFGLRQKGFDFGRLPEIATEIERQRRMRRGLIPDEQPN